MDRFAPDELVSIIEPTVIWEDEKDKLTFIVAVRECYASCEINCQKQCLQLANTGERTWWCCRRTRRYIEDE